MPKFYTDDLWGWLEHESDSCEYEKWVREHWWRDRQNWYQLGLCCLLFGPLVTVLILAVVYRLSS